MQTQTTEHDLDLVSPAATEELDTHLTPEEADEIFTLAEAEIKPLLRKMRRDTFVQNALEVFCWVGIVVSIMGMVYQLVTYPHTLVILYTPAKTASLTTTLNVPTRLLAPVTIMQSATIQTTGTGHQEANAATGTLTFYNGSYVSQTIHAGTVYAGRNSVQVALVQAVTIPAASPPQFGEANVTAQAVNVGARGNIATDDITLALSNFLTVKNLAAFTGGRDARTYKVVAPQDLTALTSMVNQTVTQAFTTAFSLQPGEQDVPTNCHATTTASQQVGAEAQSVTLSMVKTCSAVAYSSQELNRQAIAAFTRTRPGANYHLVGGVQTTLRSVSPFMVSLNGKWVYTFSQNYEQLLAQEIQGESPARAKVSLLKTGVISYASVPATLPSAMYINFLVLVG